MGRRRLLYGLSGAVLRVVLRRSIRGPRRPRWTFKHEVLMTYLEVQWRPRDTEPSFAAARRGFDKAGKLRDSVKVSRESTTVDGIPAEWTHHGDAGGTVILYLHGGGYTMGSPTSHRPLIAGLAKQTGCRILALDYRLAPEHPCPAGTEDVVTAYRWLRKECHKRVFIAGDSAGGGLAVSATCLIRDAGDPLPDGVILLSPWVDLTNSAASIGKGSDVDYLKVNNIERMAPVYAGDLARDDPRVSPLFADLSGFPPVLLQAGGDELLRDDSRRLAAKLDDVDYQEEPGEVHVFQFMWDTNAAGLEALDRIAHFVAEIRTPTE